MDTSLHPVPEGKGKGVGRTVGPLENRVGLFLEYKAKKGKEWQGWSGKSYKRSWVKKTMI